MASTYSSLKFELPGTGEQSGTWGTTTNTNIGTAIQEAIVGRATANFSTDANLTLTLTDTPASQVARNFVLNVTSSGSLTATRDLVVPAIEKPYIVQNNTTGGQSIRVIVAGGSITVPNGKTAFVYNDGTDVKMALDYLESPTIAGLAVFSGTGAMSLPKGTTGQRPGSPTSSMFRFNTTSNQFEGYDGTNWGGISGAQAGGAILTNKDTATVSYTIAAGENGLSVGPVAIDSGVTITIASGQRWLVL